MNKIEVIQFFIADSAVLFFHVRIISRTPWTNFRYKGYFCRLIGQRQRITYLFAFIQACVSFKSMAEVTVSRRTSFS